MTENETRLIAIFLLPIIWALMQKFVFKPVGKLAHKHLPPKVAEALTKKRGQ